MAVTARTWVEGEIATAAKFNTLRDDILALDAVAGVRSVQHGTIVLNNAELTKTGSIIAVTVAKTALHHLGATLDGAGGLSAVAIRIALTNTTTITATRASSFEAATVNFCVVEYK